MYILRALLVALPAVSVSAISWEDASPSELLGVFRRAANAAVDAVTSSGGSGGCPAIWTSVSSQLTTMFLTNGQCNDDARAAIRAMFHDCGTWSTDQGNTGGCDGSLILAQEYNRAENNGLQDISAKLLSLAQKNKVGVADMLVFAANHAVITCPKGPQVKTFVGRKDSSTPAPDGKLPDMHASAATLTALFAAKGISGKELAALIGAHTCSKSFHQTPPGQGDVGLPQDTTPGIWDVNYYAQTLNPQPGTFVFTSDTNLANDATVGKEFQGFVGNQGKWGSAFAAAMEKMSLFGVAGGENALIDCTNALPKGTSSKRDMLSAPVNVPKFGREAS